MKPGYCTRFTVFLLLVQRPWNACAEITDELEDIGEIQVDLSDQDPENGNNGPVLPLPGTESWMERMWNNLLTVFIDESTLNENKGNEAVEEQKKNGFALCLLVALFGPEITRNYRTGKYRPIHFGQITDQQRQENKDFTNSLFSSYMCPLSSFAQKNSNDNITFSRFCYGISRTWQRRGCPVKDCDVLVKTGRPKTHPKSIATKHWSLFPSRRFRPAKWLGHNEPCGSGEGQCDGFKNLRCRNGKCECDDTYTLQWDAKTKSCARPEGGLCKAIIKFTTPKGEAGGSILERPCMSGLECEDSGKVGEKMCKGSPRSIYPVLPDEPAPTGEKVSIHSDNNTDSFFDAPGPTATQAFPSAGQNCTCPAVVTLPCAPQPCIPLPMNSSSPIPASHVSADEWTKVWTLGFNSGKTSQPAPKCSMSSEEWKKVWDLGYNSGAHGKKGRRWGKK